MQPNAIDEIKLTGACCAAGGQDVAGREDVQRLVVVLPAGAQRPCTRPVGAVDAATVGRRRQAHRHHRRPAHRRQHRPVAGLARLAHQLGQGSQLVHGGKSISEYILRMFFLNESSRDITIVMAFGVGNRRSATAWACRCRSTTRSATASTSTASGWRRCCRSPSRRCRCRWPNSQTSSRARSSRTSTTSSCPAPATVNWSTDDDTDN